eukprot:scaffold341071_cov29-Prasinocladus_malaysianus.AAC.2
MDINETNIFVFVALIACQAVCYTRAGQPAIKWIISDSVWQPGWALSKEASQNYRPKLNLCHDISYYAMTRHSFLQLSSLSQEL